MKKASKCSSLTELKEYIDNEKPRTDIGIVEIDQDMSIHLILY